MRPTRSLVLALLLAAACGPRRDVVAVGDQSLSSEQLLGYLSRTGPGAAGAYAVADALAEGWLDLTLASEAAARRGSPADSALVRVALEPLVRTEHLRRLQNALSTLREPLAKEEVERVFDGDSLRLFQAIVVGVPDWRDRALVRTRQARADSIMRLVGAGAPFDRVSEQLSQGMGDDVTGGYGDLVTRDAIEPDLRSQLWSLDPGGLSAILATQRGFEIVRRPPIGEARGRFTALLLRSIRARADSAFADSVAAARGVSVLRTTADRLRAVLTNPDSLAADSLRIVQFEGGGLAPSEAWTWLAALPDPVRLSLARASDASLERTAESLARSEILYRMARDQGISVDVDDLGEIGDAFRAAADSLFARLSAPDASTRRAHIDSILDAVLRGEPAPRLPAGLAPALRRLTPHVFDRDALLAVARRAPSTATPPDSASNGL